jgi:hypothetical protein
MMPTHILRQQILKQQIVLRNTKSDKLTFHVWLLCLPTLKHPFIPGVILETLLPTLVVVVVPECDASAFLRAVNGLEPVGARAVGADPAGALGGALGVGVLVGSLGASALGGALCVGAVGKGHRC